MIDDPLNQLPPPSKDWLVLADRLTVEAAKQLDCMVLLVGVKEEGKLFACIEGVPESGPLKEMSVDVPSMLLTLAKALYLQQQVNQGLSMIANAEGKMQ